MKPSVFTPTHDTRYLHEAYLSLKRQTYDGWEWVIVTAPPTSTQLAIPSEIKNDHRVRLFQAPSSATGNIGALKAFACLQCRGDLLVELDHDDVLASNALAELSLAAQETKADFLFSDFVEFNSNGSSHVYPAGSGWETYHAEIDGHGYTAHRAFPANPGSLRDIKFAPNHVRAWRRDTYEVLGGHDPSLPLADDYDLIGRMYIAGYRFHHIPKPLYLYRRHQNTVVKQNAALQQAAQEQSLKYSHPILEEWCRREGLPMIDLGAAHNKPSGFIGLDKVEGVDMQCDALSAFCGEEPIEENSVGCIRAVDFLEHIPIGQVIPLMNGLYRALAPGGWLITMTPSTDGRGAFQDPTHCSFWNENSFWYYTNRKYSQFVPEIDCRFQAARLWTLFPSGWHQEHKISYVHADLIALKGQRQPGRQDI